MKQILLLAALVTLPLAASAQSASDFGLDLSDDNSDFGLDLSVEAEKKLARGLDLGIEANFRTQDNTQRAERWGLGIDLSYRFLQTSDKKFNLKGFIAFEQIWQQKLAEATEHYNSDDELNGYNLLTRHWRSRQRYSAGLSGTFKPNKRWTFQLRETVQWNHFTTDSTDRYRYRYRYNDDDKLYTTQDTVTKVFNNKDHFVLRNKLTVSYDIAHCPLEPFASIDYGCGLNYTADKWKFSIGSDYKINKHNKLSLFYRFQTENDNDEPDGHLIGLGYKFSF